MSSTTNQTKHTPHTHTQNNDREQVEQKPNESDVYEIGLQNEVPSGKKEEISREGKKAHDFDVFCESFGVVVKMTKEEKENKIKETDVYSICLEERREQQGKIERH